MKTGGVARSYDHWYESGAGDTESGGGKPWHDLLSRRLLDLTGQSVLEIGCGRGELISSLASHGPAFLLGADLSHVAVQAAAKDHRPTAFVVADINHLPFGDASFNVAISCETIEHLPEPQTSLIELSRVLLPGGRIYITTPNYTNLLGAYRLYLRLMGRRFSEGGQPINRFTYLLRVRHWIRKSNLRLSGDWSIGHYVPVPNRPPLRLRTFDRECLPWRWLGHHSIVIADKPGLPV